MYIISSYSERQLVYQEIFTYCLPSWTAKFEYIVQELDDISLDMAIIQQVLVLHRSHDEGSARYESPEL